MTFWIAGAALGGALISSNASSKAAKTQAQAATQSVDTSKQISDQQIALQREQFAAQQALEREQFATQKALQAPFQEAGVNALSRMRAGEFAQPGAFKFQTTDYRDMDYQTDPGYAFRLAEGQKALDRQAAARGGLISGGALKAASRYGQEMGSQEFQNAYQRAMAQESTNYNRALTGYNTEVARSDTGYNRLAAMAGVGQTATDKIGAAGQAMTSGIGSAAQNMGNNVNISLGNYGNAASDAYMGAANARASGYVGQANAINQGLGTYLNYTQSQNLLNRLAPALSSTRLSEPYPGYNASIGLR
jgi:hypothetical protein